MPWRHLTLLVAALSATISAPATAQEPLGISAYHAGRTSLTVSVPALREPLADRRQVAEFVSACRRSIELSASDSAAAVNFVPADLGASAFGADGVLELTVLPRANLLVDCGRRGGVTGLLEERGLWIAFDSVVGPAPRIDRVTVRRDGAQLIPIATRQGTMRRLGPRGLTMLESQVMRLAIPMELVSPDSSGVAQDLVVEVYVDSSRVPDRYVVPWTSLRELWDQVLPIRATRLAGVEHPLRFPEPSNRQLREARAAYERGASADAAALAANALWRERLDRSDIRIARAQNAAIFAEAGDTIAARVNLEYLLASDPCFSWDAAAPASVRGLLGQQRRGPGRCEPLPLRVVATRAALMPGFGQPRATPASRMQGVVVSALVVVGIAEGLRLRSAARDEYALYLSLDNSRAGPFLQYPSLGRLYERAESTRQRSLTMYGLAAAVWTVQIAHSVLSERSLAARVRESADYGEPRRRASVGLELMAPPGQRGVGVRIQW